MQVPSFKYLVTDYFTKTDAPRSLAVACCFGKSELKVQRFPNLEFLSVESIVLRKEYVHANQLALDPVRVCR